jgi:hypothetical protein
MVTKTRIWKNHEGGSLEGNDYIALAIAALETLLPLLILIVVIVIVALLLR